MSLEQNIMTAMKTAMKEKDQDSLRALRAVKSAIMLAKTEKVGTELDEAAELKILQKELKQRKDAMATFKEQNRDDLADKEAAEIAVIEKFMPEQMSEAEVKAELEKIVADTGASSMKDMGKVMGIANQKFAGKADGKMIADIVKSLLG
ncbi:MAG: GatB/YqeY domain-containing protein [Chitinophagales bacterium]